MSTAGVGVSGWLREILRCPACHGELADATDRDGLAELVCPGCQLAYPVRDGIPVLLAAAASSRS